MCFGQLLDASVRKARKDHRCDECESMIAVGQVYERQAVVDGELYAMKLCRRCAVRLRAVLSKPHAYDSCDIGHGAREQAKESGWRAWRKVMRAAREAFKKARAAT